MSEEELAKLIPDDQIDLRQCKAVDQEREAIDQLGYPIDLLPAFLDQRTQRVH